MSERAPKLTRVAAVRTGTAASIVSTPAHAIHREATHTGLGGAGRTKSEKDSPS